MRHIISIVILILSLTACGSSGSSKTPATDLVTDASPPYAKLAAIAASSPNPSPALIESFRIVLDRLSKKCTQDTQQLISAYIVKAQELLKEKSVDLTLLEIARYVDQSIPDGTEIAKCSDIFAAYVTLTDSK